MRARNFYIIAYQNSTKQALQGASNCLTTTVETIRLFEGQTCSIYLHIKISKARDRLFKKHRKVTALQTRPKRTINLKYCRKGKNILRNKRNLEDIVFYSEVCLVTIMWKRIKFYKLILYLNM